MSKIKKHFLTGLVLLIPLWVTVYIIWLFIKWISNLAKPFILTFLYILEIQETPFLIRILSFFASVLLIYLFGLITNSIVGKKLFLRIENFLIQFPIIREIYSSTKKLINFFIEYKYYKSNKVVLVEYPRKGMYCLGILTLEFKDKNKLGIFIPSTPNPTTGYFVFLSKEEVQFTDLSVEDAVQIIVSGGIVSSKEIEKYL
jgi:uncharacterized membrane protein